jgi:hypothetical protein
MKRWIVAIVVVALVALGIHFVASVVSGGRFVTGTIDRVVNDIVRVSGLSPMLVKGVVIIVTIPFFWAVAKFTKTWWGASAVEAGLDLYLNKYGIIIVAYVAAFFLTMHFASRSSYYDTTGKNLKWCSETPEGIRAFDVEGVDPVYGVPLKPCSAGQVRALRKDQVGIQGPALLKVADPRTFEFFDGVSGRPKVWFHRNPDATYELYDKAGVHPRTGAPLTAVNAAVIQELIQLNEQGRARAEEQRQQEAAAEAVRQEQAVLDRYTNAGPANHAGRTEVALLVRGEPLPGGLQQAIADGVRRHGADPVESLFKPSFEGEGRARLLAAGDWAAVSALKLGERVDAVLIAGHKLAVSANPQFEGMSSASLSLDLKCVHVVANRTCGSRSLSAQGAGFSADAAAANAAEKMMPGLRSALAEMAF